MSLRSVLLLLACLGAGCSPGFLSLEGVNSPSPSPGPSPATFTFAGRVVATQDGNRAVSGATVTVNGVTRTTAGDGSFSAPLPTAGASVIISAPGYVTRTTSVAGGQNRTSTVDLIATEAPFDLDFFERMARGKDQTTVFPNFILRWPANPNFYVITKFTAQDSSGAYVSTAQDIPAAVINRIVNLLPALVPAATGGRISAGTIQLRPDARAKVESGWVQIEFANRGGGLANDLCGFGGVDIGLANGSETDRTGFARFYNAQNCRCGNDLPADWIIAHEVGHALGFGHTMPAVDSVMSHSLANACSNNTFLERDRYHGAIAYARTVGNTSPDNDPASFSLQRIGGGVRRIRAEYSCGIK